VIDKDSLILPVQLLIVEPRPHILAASTVIAKPSECIGQRIPLKLRFDSGHETRASDRVSQGRRREIVKVLCIVMTEAIRL